MHHRISQTIVFFCFGLALLVCPRVVRADDPKLTIRDVGYSATFVSQSEADPIFIEAGETTLIRVKFKNTGTATWDASGSNYISAYTMEPRDRRSVFFGAGWVSNREIGKMAGVIKPGQTGELGVFLHAPKKVGEYKEEFYLASENNTWLGGGYFYLDIRVIPKKTVEEATPLSGSITSKEPNQASSTLYQGERVGQTMRKVSVVGGERVTLALVYRNTGVIDWMSHQVVVSEPTGLASDSLVTFADDVWKSSQIAVVGNEQTIAGDFLHETIYFRAPVRAGAYDLTGAVEVDGNVIGEPFHVNVHVTENAPVDYNPPVFASIDNTPSFSSRMSEEPHIRVGLWQTDSAVQFVSFDDDYRIFDGMTSRAVLQQKRITIISYADGVYTVRGGGIDFETSNYIRLEPVNNPHATFTLMNYDRHVSWKGAGNFNRYRGSAEYRMGEIKNTLWLVNDLLFEDYVKGIGENSNNSPVEYLKSQSVVQRSYAYAIQQSDKYGIFDVVATTGDQLYLGVGVEEITPNFVDAVVATRGYMVTYDTDKNPSTEDPVVITPYFAHTNGYTKGWHDVWGGAMKPWLVPVRAEYDDGRGLLGHGVGMSQIDASLRAKNEGLAWEELVKYYYTGVEVERMYL